jgi:hypothetical protein
MHVITRIVVRVLVLTAVAAVLVFSGTSGHSTAPHMQLVTNPPGCC